MDRVSRGNAKIKPAVSIPSREFSDWWIRHNRARGKHKVVSIPSREFSDWWSRLFGILFPFSHPVSIPSREFSDWWAELGDTIKIPVPSFQSLPGNSRIGGGISPEDSTQLIGFQSLPGNSRIGGRKGLCRASGRLFVSIPSREFSDWWDSGGAQSLAGIRCFNPFQGILGLVGGWSAPHGVPSPVPSFNPFQGILGLVGEKPAFFEWIMTEVSIPSREFSDWWQISIFRRFWRLFGFNPFQGILGLVVFESSRSVMSSFWFQSLPGNSRIGGAYLLLLLYSSRGFQSLPGNSRIGGQVKFPKI